MSNLSWVLVPLEAQFKSRLRSPKALAGAVLPTLVAGLLIGYALPEFAGPLVFCVVLAALWTGGSACVREIVDDRPLVARDPDLSILGHGLAKLAYAAALAGLHAAILTAAVAGMSAPEVPLGTVWLILALAALSGSLLAYLLSAVCDDPAAALRYFPLLLIPQVLLGGMVVRFVDLRPMSLDRSTGEIRVIPAEFAPRATRNTLVRWASEVSVSRWAAEGLAAAAMARSSAEPRVLRQTFRLLGTVGVTLADRAPSDVVARWAEGGRQGAVRAVEPEVVGRYVWKLAAFAAVKAALVLLVMWGRDPRRRRR